MAFAIDGNFINALFRATGSTQPPDLIQWYKTTLNLINLAQIEAAGVQPEIDTSEGFLLDEDALDPDSNFDFTNLSDDGKKYMRGGREYKRPYGWFRLGLNVKERFGDSSWIGGVNETKSERVESVAGEWAVSYHGTNRDAAASIVNTGAFDHSKSKRQLFGEGIYSTPNPSIAEGYAKTFSYKGKEFKVMMQNRLDMDYTDFIENMEYYITKGDQYIRPYGLLFKEC